MRTGADAAAPAVLPEARVTRAQFLQIFTGVMLPMMMGMIDQTVLATATPIIAREFRNLVDTSWIATAYLLASAATVLVFGRLGDRHGRRLMLLVALWIFTLGSVVSAVSPSMNVLIAGRVVQGLGAGGMISQCFALIGEIVPARQRASYQVYFGILSVIANILGPIIGGEVVSVVSWRWIFVVNLPLSLLATWRLLRVPAGPGSVAAPGIEDRLGLATFTIAMPLLLFAFSSAGHRFAWLSWQMGACVGIGGVLLAVLFFYEQRHRAPFFPVDLLRIEPVRWCLLSVIASTFCFLSMIFYLPFYFQLGLQADPAQSGRLLAWLLAGFLVGGVASSRYVVKTGNPQPLPVIGLAVSSAALLGLSLAPGRIAVTAGLELMLGFGLGPTMPMAQLILQTVAGRERIGAAMSLTSLARTLGGAVGTALFGAVVYSLLPSAELLVGQTAVAGAGVGEAIRVGFAGLSVVALLGSLAATRVPRVQL